MQTDGGIRNERDINTRHQLHSSSHQLYCNMTASNDSDMAQKKYGANTLVLALDVRINANGKKIQQPR